MILNPILAGVSMDIGSDGISFTARSDSPELIKCQFAGASSIINYESIFVYLDGHVLSLSLSLSLSFSFSLCDLYVEIKIKTGLSGRERD